MEERTRSKASCYNGVSSGLRLPCLYSARGWSNCRAEPADKENRSHVWCDQLRAHALQPKPRISPRIELDDKAVMSALWLASSPARAKGLQD
jgi:hypothetical protein